MAPLCINKITLLALNTTSLPTCLVKKTIGKNHLTHQFCHVIKRAKNKFMQETPQTTIKFLTKIIQVFDKYDKIVVLHKLKMLVTPEKDI